MFLYINSKQGTLILNVSHIQSVYEYKGNTFVSMQGGDNVEIIENEKKFINDFYCFIENKIGKEVGVFEVVSWNFI
ncbi:hypothetical protein [Cetobacterium sp.]|uniref:hypothetical protein n=1 Tax=Cetobacterium sp. TaxID=2071632 RepID=UPI003F3A907B